MFKQKWAATGLVFLAAFFLFSWTLELTADARLGGGRSFGSRGSRSYSSPSRTSPSPSPSYTQQRPMGQTFGGGMMRNVMAGVAGGLLGGMLFRSLGFAGPGTGMGGGIGMMDIILIGVILYGIYWFIKRKRTMALSAPSYRENTAYDAQPAYAPQPAPINDVDHGVAYVRQMDPSFDVKAFQDLCMDLFFKIQGAWMNRDISSVRTVMTDEMHRIITEDIDRLKTEKKINRLENIAVRSVDLTEVWQEEGRDFITVKIYANLLDYTTDDAGQLLSGSKTDPVKFEEYWTFTRPVGANAWQLSAISQVQ